MSATVGQERVYHEADHRPLWNDEDALQQAERSAGPPNPTTAPDDPNRLDASPDKPASPRPWTIT
jgi:hypothetical protein